MIDAKGKPLERHLYVPYKEVYDEVDDCVKWTTTISWDAQKDAAYKLFALGYNVFIHRHGWGSSCIGPGGPNGGCVTFELTDDKSVRIVDVVREDVKDPDTTPVA